MTVPEVTFSVSDSRTSGEAVRRIADRFHTRRDGRSSVRRTYYDTFDWRIFRDGGTLAVESVGESRQLAWRRADGIARRPLGEEKPPEFASDLRGRPFEDRLAPILDVRRLLPVARVEVERETLAVLDRREKTVARVHVDRGRAANGEGSCAARSMPERIRVSPVLGYDDAYSSLARYVETALGFPRQEGGELALALAAIGRQPGDYSSKIDVPLEPTMRAEAAVRRILGHLLKTLRANEDGTRRDLDPEFLHDFRVAGRRTRSCLGQVKGIFDAADLERFRGEFAWLGAVTGPTRDLDVYLLNLREYRLDLPPSLRPGLVELEAFLRERQRQAQRDVAGALDSERYARLVDAWSSFLDRPQPDGETRPNAGRPVRDLAAERIRAAFKRVRKRGRNLGDDTPAAHLHRLRIDCKKLRYLLEFFRNVFEQARVTPFVRSLKALQDQLGEFNDLEVQQRELRSSAAQMLDEARASAETLLAMGCLVGRLEARQTDLRRQLAAGVRAFVGDANREKLLELVA